jgi:hypothetical protein
MPSWVYHKNMNYVHIRTRVIIERNEEEFMENARFMATILLVLLAGSVSSCVSTNVYRPVTQKEMSGIEMSGQVQCNFYSMTYLGAGRISRSNKQQAYIELMKEASKNHQGNFDVRNITVAYVGIDTEHGNEFTANGSVVLINNSDSTD